VRIHDIARRLRVGIAALRALCASRTRARKGDLLPSTLSFFVRLFSLSLSLSLFLFFSFFSPFFFFLSVRSHLVLIISAATAACGTGNFAAGGRRRRGHSLRLEHNRAKGKRREIPGNETYARFCALFLSLREMQRHARGKGMPKRIQQREIE